MRSAGERRAGAPVDHNGTVNPSADRGPSSRARAAAAAAAVAAKFRAALGLRSAARSAGGECGGGAVVGFKFWTTFLPFRNCFSEFFPGPAKRGAEGRRGEDR